jgi:heat shock protein HslJ
MMTTSSMKTMLQTGSEIMLVLVFMFVVPACSHTLIGRGAEPPMIMVRNSTGTDLEEVSLSEAAGGGNVSRYGSVSPVPRGASQVVGRGTDPRQFPRTINLEWIDDQGSRHSRELSLKKVLRTATGAQGEALVFDIHPQGDVDVYLERPALSAAQEMENIEWRLVEVDGRGISPPAGEKWPFMKLDSVKKQAAGYAGCNNFFAGYAREGASLSFGLIGSTRRACEGPQDETERAFLKALGATRSWQIVDGVLILSTDKALARFKRADGK